MITTPTERIKNYTDKGWWGNKTLHEQLAKVANQHPNRLAVADQSNRSELTGDPAVRLSYRELHVASDNLAAQLLAQGVESGHRIIVQLPNIAELVVTYLAISKIGAIASPIPVQYGMHEFRHICDTIQANACISCDNFRGQNLAGQLHEILGNKLTVFSFSNKGSANTDGLIQLSLETTINQQKLQLLNGHQHENPSDANKIFTICWTSGTTGTPKGVPRSHNLWWAAAENTAEAGGYQQGDRLLNPFPLINMASIAPFLFGSTLCSGSLILHHPLDPALFLQQIQDEKISFTIVPPALLNQLAKSEEMWQQFDYSSLRAIGSGSAPLAPWMIEIFDHKYGKDIINFYGSNEGISLFSTPDTAPEPDIRASMFPRLGCGLRNWNTRADKIVLTKVINTDTGDAITEPGISGELVFSGATVFDGYLGTDNSSVFTADGYFRTGDLVEICGTDNRYYRIVGRSKDIINRGGMKISPVEIDILLEGLPSSAEAAVCAYKDDKLGEKICACIVSNEDQSPPSLEAVVEFLKEKGLATFKLPERLELFSRLPRNALNKVQRFALEEAVDERSS